MKYYNFTAEQAQEAVEKYRERFSVTGKYENVLYPGMGALLHDLKASGATLAIASSKPTVYVEDILVHFGIREYFDIVVGSELDGRRVHKEEVVAEVLSQLAARGESDPDKMVMIGDRSFDVEGAKAIGAHCIAVSYGYAQPGELVFQRRTGSRKQQPRWYPVRKDGFRRLDRSTLFLKQEWCNGW